MKKMSEVFNGEPCGFSTRMTDEQVRHGQHAINHVDALADALEAIINSSGNYAALFKSEYFDAVDALAAYYRGDK